MDESQAKQCYLDILWIWHPKQYEVTELSIDIVEFIPSLLNRCLKKKQNDMNGAQSDHFIGVLEYMKHQNEMRRYQNKLKIAGDFRYLVIFWNIWNTICWHLLSFFTKAPQGCHCSALSSGAVSQLAGGSVARALGGAGPVGSVWPVTCNNNNCSMREQQQQQQQPICDVAVCGCNML